MSVYYYVFCLLVAFVEIEGRSIVLSRHLVRHYHKKDAGIHFLLSNPPSDFDPLLYLMEEKNWKCPKEKNPCPCPLDYSETSSFECKEDYQCPYNYRCCKDSCYTHKVCVEREESTEYTTQESTTRTIQITTENDNIASGQTTTEESTTVEKTTTKELTTAEETTTNESTTNEETTTKESTTVEKTTTEKPPTVEETTAEISTTVEKTTTKDLTTAEETTTNESTTNEKTTTKESTTVEKTTTEKPPTVEETTAEISTTVEEATTESPTTEKKTTTEKPTTVEKTTTEVSTTVEGTTTTTQVSTIEPTVPAEFRDTRKTTTKESHITNKYSSTTSLSENPSTANSVTSKKEERTTATLPANSGTNTISTTPNALPLAGTTNEYEDSDKTTSKDTNIYPTDISNNSTTKTSDKDYFDGSASGDLDDDKEYDGDRDAVEGSGSPPNFKDLEEERPRTERKKEDDFDFDYGEVGKTDPSSITTLQGNTENAKEKGDKDSAIINSSNELDKQSETRTEDNTRKTPTISNKENKTDYSEYGSGSEESIDDEDFVHNPGTDNTDKNKPGKDNHQNEADKLTNPENKKLDDLLKEHGSGLGEFTDDEDLSIGSGDRINIDSFNQSKTFTTRNQIETTSPRSKEISIENEKDITVISDNKNEEEDVLNKVEHNDPMEKNGSGSRELTDDEDLSAGSGMGLGFEDQVKTTPEEFIKKEGEVFTDSNNPFNSLEKEGRTQIEQPKSEADKKLENIDPIKIDELSIDKDDYDNDVFEYIDDIPF